MIVDILFFIIGSLVAIIAYLFSAISFTIPDGFETGITYIFSQLNYFNGIFATEALLEALVVLFTVFALVYLVKVFLFVWSLLPWVGRHAELPTVPSHNRLDLSGKNNLLDLRKRGIKGRVIRNTRDIN